MSEELVLDDGFAAAYNDLKMKRTINAIHLKVDHDKIKIVKTAKIDSLSKLVQLLDELHCSFLVYALQGESDDGLIRMERIFTICYTPGMARPDEKLVYEMQKGKQLSKATRGAIEVHVSTTDELKRKINSVSFGASKARKDDSDENDDAKGDWMDD